MLSASIKMVEMGHMDVPKNSVPMVGAKGPRDYMTMGGMSTILKVRETIEDYDKDPGWYENPEGTEAENASTRRNNTFRRRI